MQFQADVLDIDVVRPMVTETTALGAAYAAGLAVGYWSDPTELAGKWRADRRWSSGLSNESREKLYGYWRKAVQRSLDWV
jgi:glycerol kinase